MNADPPIARYVPHSPDSIVPMNMCGTSHERLLVAPFHDGNPGISLKALSAVPTHREACKKKIPYLHPKLPTNVVEIQLPLVRKNRYGRHSTVIEGARLAHFQDGATWNFQDIEWISGVEIDVAYS